MLDLRDKYILITGATDGLGKQLAESLSKLGAKLILHGKNSEKLLNMAKELEKSSGNKVKTVLCDFRDSESIEAAFKSIKHLDILINNAGVWEEGDTLNISLEKIIELVNVNLTATLLVSRILLPNLLKADFGQILNVISVAGVEIPSGFFHTIYSATKYALQGFSEAIEKEFTNKNLRIMGFYPGGMKTQLFVKAGYEYKHDEPWMFDPIESVEAIIFMLTRNPKVNIKRLDLVNHLF